MWLMSSILFSFACMQSNSKPLVTPCYFVAEVTHKTTQKLGAHWKKFFIFFLLLSKINVQIKKLKTST
jgi:hypothetical protein